MADSTRPVDISRELAALKHERKNQNLKKLPCNASIQKRPLLHPAVAPPQAGSHVQKVVYVSCRTPVISAVKRVKKLLQHIEKRALQGIEAKNHSKAYSVSNLAELSESLAKGSEEVLVKASGRAMEQALRVGEWFRTKERDFMCNVEVRTGSVAAVDDIVVAENEDAEEDDLPADHVENYDQAKVRELEDSILEGGDTTMDILHDRSISTIDQGSEEVGGETTATVDPKEAEYTGISNNREVASQKRRRKKRKRAAYDKGDVPEARVRWVKTIEIAISLKA